MTNQTHNDKPVNFGKSTYRIFRNGRQVEVGKEWGRTAAVLICLHSVLDYLSGPGVITWTVDGDVNPVK